MKKGKSNVRPKRGKGVSSKVTVTNSVSEVLPVKGKRKVEAAVPKGSVSKESEKSKKVISKDDDIESIFSELPKKDESGKTGKEESKESESVILKDKLDRASTSIFKQDIPESSTRKFTEEGFPIYTMDELGLNTNPLAGTTPLCPFDCDCCH